MNEEFTESDVNIIKLTNGDTIVSRVQFNEEFDEESDIPESFILKCPLVIHLEKNKTNKDFGISLYPWLFGAAEHTTMIYSLDFITMNSASEDLIRQYNEACAMFYGTSNFESGPIVVRESNAQSKIKKPAQSTNDEQIEAILQDIVTYIPSIKSKKARYLIVS